jgi:type I restriction enzyme R subunit
VAIRSLAGRLSRLDRHLQDNDRRKIAEESGGASIQDLAHGLLDAVDPDRQISLARQQHDLADDAEPTADQLETAADELVRHAAEPVVTRPKLRQLLVELKQKYDQIVDEISLDELLEAAPAPQTRERAQALVQSFAEYLEEHKEEIDALQFFYSAPYGERLHYRDIRALAESIGAPPRNWTPEALWRAYEQLDQSRVRGASSGRLLTDIVSLVRYALEQDSELVPYDHKVQQRYKTWLAQQESAGRTFTGEQLRWLAMMREHIAQSLEIEMDDFDLTPFVEEGGIGRAAKVFDGSLAELVRELNEVLAA